MKQYVHQIDDWSGDPVLEYKVTYFEQESLEVKFINHTNW